MRLAIRQRIVRCLCLTLVLDVIAEAELVAAEMRRVTRPGGVIASGTFDFLGGTSALDLVLDTGAALDEGIRTLRAQIKARPIVWAGDRQLSGIRLGSSRSWRRRSCSASTTPTSRTTGPAGRQVQQGLRNVSWLRHPICGAKSSSMFKPVTWPAYRTGLDRLPPSSEPYEGRSITTAPLSGYTPVDAAEAVASQLPSADPLHRLLAGRLYLRPGLHDGPCAPARRG